LAQDWLRIGSALLSKMSIFASWSNGGMASAQSAGGQASARATSIFAAAGGSSTGGQEESMSGSSSKNARGGGGTFGSSETSVPAYGGAAPSTKAAAPSNRPPSRAAAQIETRSALEEATRVPDQPDMKMLAPLKTGDNTDIKKLLEQLQGASTAITVNDYQSSGIEHDNEVPDSAHDELRDMTKMLMALSTNTEVLIPVAGHASFQHGEMPNLDNDKAREDDLRETFKLIHKTNVREADHSATSR